MCCCIGFKFGYHRKPAVTNLRHHGSLTTRAMFYLEIQSSQDTQPLSGQCACGLASAEGGLSPTSPRPEGIPRNARRCCGKQTNTSIILDIVVRQPHSFRSRSAVVVDRPCLPLRGAKLPGHFWERAILRASTPRLERCRMEQTCWTLYPPLQA